MPQRAISKSWLAFWEYLKKVDPRPFVYEIRRHHQHHHLSSSSSLAFCRALQIFVFCCAFLSLYLFGYKIIKKSITPMQEQKSFELCFISNEENYRTKFETFFYFFLFKSKIKYKIKFKYTLFLSFRCIISVCVSGHTRTIYEGKLFIWELKNDN